MTGQRLSRLTRLLRLYAASRRVPAAAGAGALAAAGAGGQLAGGTLDVVRNTAGITGLGLLGAALAWAAPTAYLVAAVYALYTQWHPPALATPWLWPARPPHDAGGAVCAALVFAAGLAAVAGRGARDRDPAPGWLAADRCRPLPRAAPVR